MKKLFAIILVFTMLFSLAACSSNGSDTPTGTPSPDTADPGNTDAPDNNGATSTDTYTLSFASSFGAGSDFNVMMEEPLKALFEEKSDGRITLEIYASGSLASQGAGIDAVTAGTADIAYDMTAIYAGAYPYLEMFDLPGWYIPGSKNGSALITDYDEAFAAVELEDVKVIGHFSTGNLGIASSKPIRSIDDMNGVQLRASGTQISWIENCGGTGVAMPVTEVYESVKLNIIGGAVLSPYAITAFNLQEVAPYFTNLPMLSGGNIIVMSLDLYESMNDVDKAIVDEVIAEFSAIAADYGDACTEKAMEELGDAVEFIALSDEETAKFIEKALPLIEAKAKALDDAGLQGTAAKEWLEEQTAAFN